jgi:hypothetical protein
MTNRKQPTGLEFLQRIAKLTCGEYNFTHEWISAGPTQILKVQCGDKTLEFHYELAALGNSGSPEYRQLIEKTLARLLQEFRAMPPATAH